MIPNITSYKDGDYDRPNERINPSDKNADYHKKWSQFVYALYLRGSCAWGVDGYNKFSELRSYSLGKQNCDKYKVWLSSEVSTNQSSTIAVDSFDSTPLSRISRREGWYNLMFDNISPAPTILEALHGQFDELDYDLYTNVIDANSKDIEENEAYQRLVEGIFRDWQIEYKQKAGIPVDEDTYYPKSIQEFEAFKAQDGFKLNVARSIQRLLRYTFGLSPNSWDTVTRKKVIDDIICLGYAAVRDYFDAEDNKFKQKWIDPARLVVQYSNSSDYNDSEYHGYFEFWTVSNLKQKLPDVAESKWLGLAKANAGQYGNFNWDSKYSKLDPSTYMYGYDGFKVPVFETEWIDCDSKKRKYYKDRYGRDQVKDVDYNTKEKTTAQSEIKSLSVRLVRECKWVVGTDYTFDTGVVKMASRRNYSKPQSTFHVEQLLQTSIMERLIPILDQIEITFLRYQNSLAKMVENGYAVNTSMLGNVTLGGNKLKPAEVIKLYKQTGFFLYQYSAGTGLYTGGAALPISEIPGGMKNRVEETIRTLDMWLGQIKTQTGIDVVALSSQPQAVDTSEGAQETIQITQNIFKTITNAVKELKQSVGESLMRRIQIGVRNSDVIRKAYAGVISKTDMDALVMMESEHVQYGLSLKAKPDRRAKLRFENWVNLALQNTREQRPGIDLNDAIFFMSQLENGADISELEKQLQYTIDKNKQEAAAQSQQMIESQGEQQRQTDAQKAQIEMAKLQMEQEGKIKEELIRGDIKNQQANKEIVRDVYSSLVEAANAESGINTSIRR